MAITTITDSYLRQKLGHPSVAQEIIDNLNLIDEGAATMDSIVATTTPFTIIGQNADVGGAIIVAAGSSTGSNVGGSLAIVGGAGIDGDGGAVTIGGGVSSGALRGPVILGSAALTPIFYPQAAPATDGADTPFTATVAQLVAGMISMTPTTGRSITTPTGAAMDAGVAFTSIPAAFGFDFTIQNRAAFAATDDIITLVAGATGATVTGSATVSPGSAARFRAVRTATATWIFYKIAG